MKAYSEIPATDYRLSVLASLAQIARMVSITAIAAAAPIAALAVSLSCSGSSGDQSSVAQTRTFGVYALSRGQGVPAAARAALRSVEAIVAADEARGVVVRTKRTRLGIEGEVRLCVEYGDGGAAVAALERVRKAVEGIELVNIEIEPCMNEGKTS